MINHKQLREYIIKPSLDIIDMYDRNSEEIIILTCAKETLGGTYIHQINGRALGIYEMEPATYAWIWTKIHNNDFDKKEDGVKLSDKILKYLGKMKGVIPEPELMIGNLYYATMMCRLRYACVRDPLPDYKDVKGMAQYYKMFYNTSEGKSNIVETIDCYEQYLRGK